MDGFRPGTVPLLRIEGLSKTFPGTRALSDVSLDVWPGTVHALVGQNGCGKSTLIKILSGYHRADPGGQVWLDGELHDLATLAESSRDRIRFVHQDLGLVLELGAMDNIALRQSFVRGRLGNIDWKTQAEIGRDLLDRFGVHIDLRQPLSELPPVTRVVVAIVAAVQGWEDERGLLVLDEPTAVLPPHEVEELFSILNELRQTSASILYVSHRIDEIFEIADEVSVLREGRMVTTTSVTDLTPRGLATLMAGESVEADYRTSIEFDADAEIALEARNVQTRELRGVDITVRRGEVLGFAGLLGSGREELPYALSGALGATASGEMRVPAVDPEWVDIADAARLGLPFVPAERASEAIVAEFTVGENLTLRVLDRLRAGVSLSARREKEMIDTWVDRLRIRTPSNDTPIAALSGGNQQKVVLARCLAQEPSVLLLCEPTAGVDIGTRISIYDLIAMQGREGLAVLVSSSDIGDLLAVCTRVVVLRDGRVVREIESEELDKAAILHAMEGTEEL
jgi:ABC-type sugar transport system ATPase subunit